jgi:hypothetical protein
MQNVIFIRWFQILLLFAIAFTVSGSNLFSRIIVAAKARNRLQASASITAASLFLAKSRTIDAKTLNEKS